MPESAIPAAAVLRGDSESHEVAVGAIIGAPFMLATIALALVGVAAFVFSGRRTQGPKLDVPGDLVKRDLTFFLALLVAALAVGLGVPRPYRPACAPLFVLAYLGYVVLTVRHGGRVESEEELPALIADR